ncbi:MAG TPA: IS1634 family transposase [Anaerovoracaceae bacterium]|nr:IS1634 family transposase [Anaerovoracaceae bacterium]
MKLTISKSKNAEQLYICKSIRVNKNKTTSQIFKKLGSMESLLPLHDNDREKVIAWAKEQAAIYTEAERQENLEVLVKFAEGRQIEKDERLTFNGGYLFLQDIFHEIGFDKICKQITDKYNFEFDFADILAKLIYTRIIAPSSKCSSFEYSKKFIETPKFDLHQIYRALDVINNQTDFIQESTYSATLALGKRNTGILYYDCTNYFFEIDEPKDDKQFGKSKENRPNPIVQMGLLMDGDGLPLAFTTFAGNESEQPTLIPLEKRIVKDFHLAKFVVCTDAGLASTANRKFNNINNRSYVVTQPLKKIKKHLKEWALDPKGWYLINDSKQYNLNEIDERIHMNSIFYKERWINENGIEQRLIVSFSPKYKAYQESVRSRQIERALKIIDKGEKAHTRNSHSPTRFIDEIKATDEGEVATKSSRSLDAEKIAEEAAFDGFYAVCTTLEDDISEIIKINKRRWEIEESFKIMKSEFKARPVFLQDKGRIKAHFTTCFLSLLIFRLLERKLNEKYTVTQIISTLREMNFRRLKGIGYLPGFTRTDLTDELHRTFGFNLDTEIITDKKMKKIIKKTKH